ncbi:unnamed protein product [Trichobilharzia regenti]|nr:unnamed protein product [Trichobilharzia regenti]
MGTPRASEQPRGSVDDAEDDDEKLMVSKYVKQILIILRIRIMAYCDVY